MGWIENCENKLRRRGFAFREDPRFRGVFSKLTLWQLFTDLKRIEIGDIDPDALPEWLREVRRRGWRARLALPYIAFLQGSN